MQQTVKHLQAMISMYIIQGAYVPGDHGSKGRYVLLQGYDLPLVNKPKILRLVLLKGAQLGRCPTAQRVGAQ